MPKGASIFEDGRRGTGFGKRPFVAVVATIGVTGALALAGSGTPPATVGQAAANHIPPNVLVISSDDQTLESMRVSEIFAGENQLF